MKKIVKKETVFQEWLLTQKIVSVADALGVTRQTVYLWMSGGAHPSHTMRVRIRAAFPQFDFLFE